jgi:hypothetical protein
MVWGEILGGGKCVTNDVCAASGIGDQRTWVMQEDLTVGCRKRGGEETWGESWREEMRARGRRKRKEQKIGTQN